MEVRGTALRSVLVACDEEFGAGSSKRVLDAVDPAFRVALQGAVLSTAWYPVAAQAALHEAVRVALGYGSMEANRRVGRRAALDDFRGVYRVFLPLLTWEFLWSSLDRAWSRYNTAGRVTCVAHGERRARFLIAEVQGYTDPMWHAICGRMCGIIELAGGRDVHGRVLETSATRGEFEFDWDR